MQSIAPVHRMSRRRLLGLTAVSSLAFVAACRGPAGTSPRSPAVAGTARSGPAATVPAGGAGPVSLTYYHFFAPGDPQMVILPHTQKIFAKQFPRVTVHAQFNAGGAAIETKLETMLAGGTPPDAATINPQIITPLYSRGALMNLTPAIQQDAATFDPGDFYKPTLTRVIQDGKQYGIPLQMGLFVVVYNKTMFDQAGVGYPSDQWTWEGEFVQAAEKLTKGSGGNKTYGTVLPPLEIPIWANGGAVFTKDGKKCLLDQAPAYEAIQWMGDLIFKYHVAPRTADVSMLPWQLFLANRLAMDLDITGSVSQIARGHPKFDWDVAPVPKGKKGRFTIVQGPSMVVFQASKNRDLAWKWIELYTGKEVQYFGAKVAQVVSARRSADQAYVALPPPPKHRSVQVDSVSFAHQHFYMANWAKVNNLITSDLDPVLTTNTESAKQATATLCQHLDPLLQK